jgi:alkylation response protein AidB-like acyl-CoA dehydrogenase
MDFRLGDKSEALRAETRKFLDEVLTPEILVRCQLTGVNHDAGFARALRDKGWLTLDWPVEDGGQGRDPLEVLAHHEEMRYRHAPMYAVGTTMTIARLIQQIGTPEQRASIVPRAMNADIVIALGITEPENGSDAAAATTRAMRTADGWTINGSKMFTTNAHIADYVFMLARTNLDAPKHRGLTVFLVPLDQPGVEVQKVVTMSGERTNITFYQDVFVSDAWRIGEVDQGWSVMAIAFATEHSACFVGEQRRLVEALAQWADIPDQDGHRRIEDADVQVRIGRSYAEIEVSTLLEHRAAWLRAQGEAVHGKASMVKLFSSERLEAQADQTLALLGPDGLRGWGDPTAVQDGGIEHMARHAKGTTIYAGTSEIQRNIIAQHDLGLPRPH